jgi:hypothetical protein
VRPYLNLSGTSGIAFYETGSTFIRVWFHDGRLYTYTYESAGCDNIERMKELAVAGRGLSTYISQHPEVRNGYVR